MKYLVVRQTQPLVRHFSGKSVFSSGSSGWEKKKKELLMFLIFSLFSLFQVVDVDGASVSVELSHVTV